MSDDSALVPIEQKVILFYEDEITAVRMENGAVFVPIRPLVEQLGISWSGQRERINRDAVLSEESATVRVTRTEGDRQITRELLCLPLDYLNGWLFGISAERVKPEIRERLIRYQKECYRILARAFVREPANEASSTSATLLQVREMGLAIVRMAEEQIEFERRLTTSESRLDQAAIVVGDLNRRMTALEQKVAPGKTVTEEQASQISQAVKAVALALGKQSGRNEFGAIYGELYRKFGITGYKMLPATQFDKAMKFLNEWYQSITGEGLPF
ncbi:MAG: ORF6C domain-containing protein [Anaerolineae bacterium]|nr:ORF6C domain-containing protein [Anaerolineae bacterium]